MEIVLRLLSLDLWILGFQVRLHNVIHFCFDVEDTLHIETIGSPTKCNGNEPPTSIWGVGGVIFRAVLHDRASRGISIALSAFAGCKLMGFSYF